ncbi:DUF305 domain-containing protein [Gordonia sp. ABSL1-1]|uniref:DUF305 domain-containing protein n=1 Tax=Gordonia sp. ABSL1-1 TaxID=3053923 RepID=UPI00257261C6|nr:DUF305 domain-containing protein [Gordonia sp. ABSL1-1]MDL9938037.1 DUF305 domain-containing protein [Gordonia sp. ABSL1-1]
MSDTSIPNLLRGAGVAVVAVLVLAIGAVAGAAWQSHQADHPPGLSNVDIGFAQDMSTHHDQALLMARTVSGLPGVSEEIRVFADRLVLTQTAETATMRGWLQLYDEPLTPTTPMAWMADAAPAGRHQHGAPQQAVTDPDAPPMPGMASIDDLGRLSSSTGRDAEVCFLQLMIRHHRGGLSMAQAAYNSDQAGTATKQLALTMIGDQGNEIGQMTLLLKARNSDPLPT